MTWRLQRTKQRFILFTAKDEAIFSEALRDRYPTVRFVEWSGGARPPRHIEAMESLVDLSGGYAYIVVPNSMDWQPISDIDPADGHWRGFGNLPRIGNLRYARSAWDWAFFGSPRISYDAPTLNPGDIQGAYQPGDPQHKTFLVLVHQIWKIIERLATNRYKHGHPLGNELSGGDSLLMKDAKPGYAWVGHHALEWSRAQPRRMLAGSWRACDDWHVPQNEWYLSLRRRVEEKYGPDIGSPPPIGSRGHTLR